MTAAEAKKYMDMAGKFNKDDTAFCHSEYHGLSKPCELIISGGVIPLTRIAQKLIERVVLLSGVEFDDLLDLVKKMHDIDKERLVS